QAVGVGHRSRLHQLGPRRARAGDRRALAQLRDPGRELSSHPPSHLSPGTPAGRPARDEPLLPVAAEPAREETAHVRWGQGREDRYEMALVSASPFGRYVVFALRPTSTNRSALTAVVSGALALLKGARRGRWGAGEIRDPRISGAAPAAAGTGRAAEWKGARRRRESSPAGKCRWSCWDGPARSSEMGWGCSRTPRSAPAPDRRCPARSRLPRPSCLRVRQNEATAPPAAPGRRRARR